MSSLFRTPPRVPLIAPSVLAGDFARIGEDCLQVLGAGADLLHVDIMDGHFVPNLTMGPDVVKGLRRVLPGVFLDTHLMVTDPGRFAEPFIKAGANHVTFHVEVLDEQGLRSLANRVRALGATAGIAINPPTPVGRMLPVIDAFDLVLVMSVNPGFGGQKFIAEVLSKTRTIRPLLRPDQRLEMDGGIDRANAAAVREAGCDVIVAGTSIFGDVPADRKNAIAALRSGSENPGMAHPAQVARTTTGHECP
ncbi:MAG: ribulose-phosphate 3-epimerase [Phycisphaerales bacterium]|nr:ribulose-phosphate 3-epimerase [Phycisphaerales bacterium]